MRDGVPPPPPHQLVHSQLTQHSFLPAGLFTCKCPWYILSAPSAADLSVRQRVCRLGPDLSAAGIRRRGAKLPETVGGGSCPRPQVLKAHSHSSASSCAPGRDRDARRAPESSSLLLPTTPPSFFFLSRRAADVGLWQVPTRGY